jgi:hypothetical protein
MERMKFEALLVLLVPQVVSEIVRVEGISEKEAVERFYESGLYAVLEDEKTKLWHLSPKAMYQLYDEERKTGNITFPEGV